MGVIVSKFRKEKTTAEILENIQEDIQKLENYTINTQERKKRFVTNFLGVSIGLYVVLFAWCYFFYLPPTWNERIVYLVPLMLFPVFINLLRKLFTWYFQRKLNKNSDKLRALREKKNKILEQVMDKETYKVAVNLLERYGDRKVNRISLGLTSTSASNVQNNNTSLSSNNALNRTQLAPATRIGALTSTPQRQSPSLQQQQQLGTATTPYTSVYRTMAQQSQQQLQLTPGNRVAQVGQDLRRRTPFPIVDTRNRGAFDRIIDALVGDSPHDRFAMICKECYAHNGMAPKEQYDYAAFRCAFCNVLNPARKARPVAPRLSLEQQQKQPGTPLHGLLNNSDSESTPDDDSDNDDIAHVAPTEQSSPNTTESQAAETELTNDSKITTEAAATEKAEEAAAEAAVTEVEAAAAAIKATETETVPAAVTAAN